MEKELAEQLSEKIVEGIKEDGVGDDDSTNLSIDLSTIKKEDRTGLMWWFYSSKFVFTLIFIVLAFILIVIGKIDQYVYAGVVVAALAAYITGKIEKNYFKK